MTGKERILVEGEAKTKTAEKLQGCLVTLIDLSLQLKQAHWNLIGDQFQSFHEQLDAIIADVRRGSDEVAERIATLGVAADGRAAAVAEWSALESVPTGRMQVPKAVTMVADRLNQSAKCLRDGIETAGDTDPITEDLLIGICAKIEKHMWMVQSREL